MDRFNIWGNQHTFYLEGGRFKIVVQGPQTEKEVTVDGVLVHKKTYGGKLLKNTNHDFLHTDHLGSVNVVSNEQGKVKSRTQYNVWGEQIRIDGYISDTTKMGFTEHETLHDNLVHMNGRVYDSATARFMSADLYVPSPFSSQSYNRYAHVFNNPLGYTDATGYIADDPNSSCAQGDLKCNDAEQRFKEEQRKQEEEFRHRQRIADEANKQENNQTRAQDALSTGDPDVSGGNDSGSGDDQSKLARDLEEKNKTDADSSNAECKDGEDCGSQEGSEGESGAQKTPAERAKAKLTNQPLSGSKLSKANPAVGQGCGAYQCRTGGKHAGVDILATDGAKLQAPGSGTASVGYLKGYGKTVLINHGDGVQTRFAHLGSYTVKEGAKVTVTTDIGTVGRTGNVPSGGQSHLHFEVLVDGNRINPSDVFTWAQDK